MDPLRIGIVGGGPQMLGKLLPAAHEVGNVEVVAVCDRDAKAAAELARRCPGARVYHAIGDFENPALGILHHDALDCIVAAAPPAVHFELAKRALKLGIPVFVEKPPCTTFDELAELVVAERTARCATAVGMNFRHAAAIRTTREIVNDAAFGPVAHVHIEHFGSLPTETLWGQSPLRSYLLGNAIHPIDLAAVFLGPDMRMDPGRGNVRRGQSGLFADLRLSAPGGATATVLTGTVTNGFDFRLSVYGTRARVTVNALWEVTHETAGDAKWRYHGVRRSPLDSGYARSGYAGELAAFFDAVRERRPLGAFASLLPTYRVIEELCAGETNEPKAATRPADEPEIANKVA